MPFMETVVHVMQVRFTPWPYDQSLPRALVDYKFRLPVAWECKAQKDVLYKNKCLDTSCESSRICLERRQTKPTQTQISGPRILVHSDCGRQLSNGVRLPRQLFSAPRRCWLARIGVWEAQRRRKTAPLFGRWGRKKNSNRVTKQLG